MINIVFLDAYSAGDSSLEAIRKLGNLTIYEDTNQAQVVERSKEAHIVISNKVKIFKEQIDELPNLKLICVAATGTNNIDSQYAASKGIVVKNVPAYSTQSVAEATFSFVLALLRQVPFYNDYVKNGSYSASGRWANLDRGISEICGKRWGVISMGNIGQRVAAIATAFGAEVCYYSTSGRNTEQPYASVSLEELLATSDIVSIHSPLNDATAGLIAKEQFSKMKPNAILINVGRGGIVNEEDLADALDNGVIAGAALDVFENEPLEQGSPLLSIKDKYKLVAAPHCGWSSAEARKVLFDVIAKNIEQYFETL